MATALTLYLSVISFAEAKRADVSCYVETGTRFRSKANIEVWGLKPGRYMAAISSNNGPWVYSKPRRAKGHIQFEFDSNSEVQPYTPIGETFIVNNAIKGQVRDAKTRAQIIKPIPVACQTRVRD